eukprot:scaffold34983_cov229-Amphora_coffeaeformis.AAC.2
MVYASTTVGGDPSNNNQDADDTEFDFDEDINRREVPFLKYSALVLGGNDNDEDMGEKKLFVAGVADMDFAVAPCIQAAVQERCQHVILGYETVLPGLVPAVCKWMQRLHYTTTTNVPDSP